MPATNDFLPFAVGGGANVLTQAQYAALTTLLANGFTAGTALSVQLNKVWRQSSIMAAVLAQYIADETGANAVDDGTTATLLANLKSGALSPRDRTSTATGGTSDAITATFATPPLTWAAIAGIVFYARAATANTLTNPTITNNSGTLAPKTIVKGNNLALAAGDIAGAGHWIAYQYDATLDKVVLLNPALGAGGPFVKKSGDTMTGALRGAVVALVDGATITPDFAAGNNFSVTLGGNRTLANPSNLTAGQSGVITITQDATGGRTLAFGSQWKFAAGSAPTLTTTANAVDDLAYYVESATRIVAKLVGDVR